MVFSRFDVVEPDLLYLSKARADAVLTAANVQGAPNLVVDILSPSTRKQDEAEKRRLYERSGVDEYWVVDPDNDRVRVYRRGGVNFAAPVDQCGDIAVADQRNIQGTTHAGYPGACPAAHAPNHSRTWAELAMRKRATVAPGPTFTE